MAELLVSDGAVQLATEYWYIAVSVLIVAILALIAAGCLIVKARKLVKENQEVQKGRRREELDRRRRAEMLSQKKLPAVKEDGAEIVAESTDGAEPYDLDGVEDNVTTKEEIIPVGDEPISGEEEEDFETMAEVEKTEKKAIYRVVYDKENKEWLIKKDGATRVIRRVKTKAEALELATQFAENQDLAMSVQKKDGKFQKKSNYTKMLPSDKKD